MTISISSSCPLILSQVSAWPVHVTTMLDIERSILPCPAHANHHHHRTPFPWFQDSSFYHGRADDDAATADAKWRRAEETLRRQGAELADCRGHIVTLETMLETVTAHLEAADKVRRAWGLRKKGSDRLPPTQSPPSPPPPPLPPPVPTPTPARR